jgi:hypothetical protein
LPKGRLASRGDGASGQLDADDVVLLLRRPEWPDTELHLPNLVGADDVPLGQEETRRQLEIVAGRPHSDVIQDRFQRFGMSDPEFERFLGCQPVRSALRTITGNGRNSRSRAT